MTYTLGNPDFTIRIAKIDEFLSLLTCELRIEAFSGTCEFECFTQEVARFFSELADCHERLSGIACLNTISNDEVLQFTYHSIGKVLVVGILENWSRTVALNFKVETDQSYITGFLRGVEE